MKLLSYDCQPTNQSTDGVDGVILFSDILTPLPAMGIDFTISEQGSIRIDPPLLENDTVQVDRLQRVTVQDYREKCPFVQTVLQDLSTKLSTTTATKQNLSLIHI